MKANRPRTSLVAVAGALVLAVLVTGCDYVKDSDELIGVYEARYSFGTERLQIRPDGTYVQTIRVDGDSVITNHGNWDFRVESQYSHLYLDDAMVAGDVHDRLRPRFWETKSRRRKLPTERIFGKVKLEIHPDFGIYYVKITSEESTATE